MNIRKTLVGLRRLLWKAGIHVSRFRAKSHPLARRKRLMNSYEIEVVLDVGASVGQYATQLRRDVGFRGRIVSFEPLIGARQRLQRKALKDPGWEVLPYALGAANGSCEINVAGNSFSSSFLRMLPSHVNIAPESTYVGTEKVDVRTLDSLFPSLVSETANVYLKIDTQGFERDVLKGAQKALQDIDTVQMEMSLTELYEGEALIGELLEFMTERGYELVSLEPGFTEPGSGRLLQVDGIFHRF